MPILNTCQLNCDPDWTQVIIENKNPTCFNVIKYKGLYVIVMRETPKMIDDADKPLLNDKMQSKKVDINILKARAKEIQDKENLKNTIVVVFFLLVLGAAGVYFSI